MLDMTHPVRLGILKERPYLTDEFTNTYSALICNANLTISFGAGVASLLRQAVGRRGTVSGFLIDPMTHSVCMDRRAITNDEGRVKSGLEGLFKAYGLSDREIAKLPLTTAQAAEGLGESFVSAVLAFQRNRVRELSSEDNEYLAFADAAGKSLPAFDPGIVMAPYLYMNDGPDAKVLLKINGKLYERARALTPHVAALVAVQKTLIRDVEFRSSLVEQLSDLKPPLVLLWIARLDEHRNLGSEFWAAKDLMLQLARKNLQVVRLYASFFTYSLREPNLIGVAHGPGYGEERNEVPVGGGIPRPKYYFPPLYRRLDFDKAAVFVKNEIKDAGEFFRRVCGCPQCRAVIGKDLANFDLYGEVRSTRMTVYDRATKIGEEREIEYASPEQLERATKHYMYAKFDEVRGAQSMSRPQLQTLLRSNLEWFQATVLQDEAQHLSVWAQD